MQGVPVEAVQVMTGASEALVALMWLAAEPGANVIIPLPGYPPFSMLPREPGLEILVQVGEHVRAGSSVLARYPTFSDRD